MVAQAVLDAARAVLDLREGRRARGSRGSARSPTPPVPAADGRAAIACAATPSGGGRSAMRRELEGLASAARLIETVLALETVKEIQSLRPLLQRS